MGASGNPPSNVKKNDLAPDVTYDEAHSMMGKSIANWIRIQVGGAGIDTSAAQQAIDAEVQSTGTLLQPLIDGLEQEAYHHFQPACNSDYPMPDCPAYPRYPSGQQGTTAQTGCTCGTPWAADVAQPIMAGNLPNGVTVDAVDAIHSVSDITPIHLPHIFSNCTSNDKSCRINSTTVTQAIYSSLDSFDTGFYFTTASKLRVKLKSRQAMQLAGGTDPSMVNFTQTDVLPSNCAEINQRAYQWALNRSSEAARNRFSAKGQPLVMGQDIFKGNAGPLWIYNSLKYTAAPDNSHVVVSAPCSHTPVDYSIKSAAGYHYCKLLSPARAMEWIYIDGLRAHGGL